MKKRNKEDIIIRFDVSTLYSEIPHNKLLKVMYELMEFCFDGGDKTTTVL